MNQLKAEYSALTSSAGFVQLANRTLVSVTGKDRHQLLHSFCTADIKALEVGQTTEAFVLNGKGKILSHVLIFSLAETLLLSGSPDQAATLIEHLDKYIIREDVSLEDHSKDVVSFFVCGPEAAASLEKLTAVLPQKNQVVETVFGEVPARVANVEIAGWGYMIIVDEENQGTLLNSLSGSSLTACKVDALQVLRIERGTPWFGSDMDDRNLPQELQRDEQAISFTKGCYLGQETVARIDALGHVNQLLVQLTFSSAVKPAVDTELLSDSKVIGRVTSIAKKPDGQWIGLGYVKRAKAKPGTLVEYENGSVTVS